MGKRMDEQIVVITGGNGFVGRHLVAELRRAQPAARLVVWDRQLDGLPEGAVGEVVDITRPDSYRERLSELKPAWIVHLAAVPSAEQARLDEMRARHVNVEGTRQLLEAAEELSPATKVLAVSTADIYGQGSSTPLPELSLKEARPRNPYAQSKWEMERLIEETYNDRVVRVRPFPHLGPGQALGYVTADFAAQIAAIEGGQQSGVLRVGNLEAIRDFTDVRDVVRAYRLLLSCGVPGEVYHVASGRVVRIQQVLDGLRALSPAKIAVEQDPTKLRPADTPVLIGSAEKLRAATAGRQDGHGWEATIALEQSWRDILAWWRERVAVVV
ncbi:MAG: NAD-dependent epimerase/dehydratase family protein [Candidatus Andersenbacteria bacterium]|nr:NAD-dependent epimerase/dehydratase family protein [Candidatus Andersenbacteria bacterium]